MNTWPGGKRHAMEQDDHEQWNSAKNPGTRQLCVTCEQPTGRCEDDAIYTGEGQGPLCEDCYNGPGLPKIINKASINRALDNIKLGSWEQEQLNKNRS